MPTLFRHLTRSLAVLMLLALLPMFTVRAASDLPPLYNLCGAEPPLNGTIGGTVNVTPVYLPAAPIEIIVTTLSGAWVAATTTTIGTRYSFSLLPGQYYVQAVPRPEPMRTSYHAPAFYPGVHDREQAVPVTVVGGQSNQNINFLLPEYGRAYFTVYPMLNVEESSPTTVTAYRPDGQIVQQFVYRTFGAYVIQPLPAGDYYFSASRPNYVTRWFPDSPDRAGAQPVTIPPGDNTQYRAITLPYLTTTATITGRTGAEDSASLYGNVVVSAYDAQSGMMVAQTRSRYNDVGSIPFGHYRLNVPAGLYVLRAGQVNHDFAPEYYNDQQMMTDADPLTVSDGAALTGIDFTQPMSGTIAGRVQWAGGAVGMPFVRLDAYNEQGISVGHVITNYSTGTYRLAGMGPGRYTVRASRDGWNTRWHSSAAVQNAATYLDVDYGIAHTGVDFILYPETGIRLILDYVGGGRCLVPEPMWSSTAHVTLIPSGMTAPDFIGTQTVDAHDALHIDNLLPVSYQVTLRASGALTERFSLTVVTGRHTQVSPPLRLGDANADNTIDALDFSLLLAAYNTARDEPGFDARADFNADARITILDFSLLARNFGQVGD